MNDIIQMFIEQVEHPSGSDQFNLDLIKSESKILFKADRSSITPVGNGEYSFKLEIHLKDKNGRTELRQTIMISPGESAEAERDGDLKKQVASAEDGKTQTGTPTGNPTPSETKKTKRPADLPKTESLT